MSFYAVASGLEYWVPNIHPNSQDNINSYANTGYPRICLHILTSQII